MRLENGRNRLILEFFATILLLIKNLFILYTIFCPARKLRLIYICAKTFFSIFVFCPEIGQKYSPVFQTDLKKSRINNFIMDLVFLCMGCFFEGGRVHVTKDRKKNWLYLPNVKKFRLCPGFNYIYFGFLWVLPLYQFLTLDPYIHSCNDFFLENKETQ